MVKVLLLKLLSKFSKEYVHLKTGNKYRVLFISNEYSGRDGFPQTVVYMSKGGVIYSRPLSEFTQKFKIASYPKVFPI